MVNRLEEVAVLRQLEEAAEHVRSLKVWVAQRQGLLGHRVHFVHLPDGGADVRIGAAVDELTCGTVKKEGRRETKADIVGSHNLEISLRPHAVVVDVVD